MPICRNCSRRFGLSPSSLEKDLRKSFSTDEGLSPKRLEQFLHIGTEHSSSRTIFYLSLFDKVVSNYRNNQNMILNFKLRTGIEHKALCF